MLEIGLEHRELVKKGLVFLLQVTMLFLQATVVFLGNPIVLAVIVALILARASILVKVSDN